MEHDIVNVAQTKQPTIFAQFMNLVKNNELSMPICLPGKMVPANFQSQWELPCGFFLYERSKWRAMWEMF